MAQRTCRDCGKDISGLHGSAKLCLTCRPDTTMQRTQRRRARYPERFCADCGAEITNLHGNVRRCLRCRTVGPPRERRYCRDCGVDITDLYALALRCEACRAPKGRGTAPRTHQGCAGSDCYCSRDALAAMALLSSAEIAKRFDITQQTVNYWRKKFGLPRPPVARPIHGNNQKYGTDRDFFARIDTPAKAYILGFIIADGSIHKNGKGVTIAIQKNDVSLLREIAAELGCTAPIGRKVPSRSPSGMPLAVLNLCGRKLTADLNALGVHHDKSYTATYPTVPEHLESHLIRGLWDGDGWIGKRQFSLAGTHALVEGVADSIYRHTGCRLRIRKASNGSDCYYAQGSRRDRAVMQWLYADPGLAMARKAGVYWLHWM